MENEAALDRGTEALQARISSWMSVVAARPERIVPREITEAIKAVLTELLVYQDVLRSRAAELSELDHRQPLIHRLVAIRLSLEVARGEEPAGSDASFALALPESYQAVAECLRSARQLREIDAELADGSVVAPRFSMGAESRLAQCAHQLMSAHNLSA
jgi:hypothetical protein